MVLDVAGEGHVSGYRDRVVDDELRRALARAGAVLVEGPKACGKTFTASRVAATQVRLDNPAEPRLRAALELDLALLLDGTPPVLLDEWQEVPALWNLVRHEVDDRRAVGQFILTGSSTPDDAVRRHSGAGRFSIIQMRPMSLAESGDSSKQVSLAALFEGAPPKGFDATWSATQARQRIAELVIAGGWPGNLGMSVTDAALANRDYVNLVREYDIQRVAGHGRDPETASRVMRALARNVATPAREATIARDVREGETGTGPDATSRDTVTEHLDALTRLRIVEDQPAWAPNLRSSRRLRSSPKRHFVDPSLAAAVLGVEAAPLAADPITLGFLFESLVVRDLRVYAQPLGGHVSYYRDETRLEADAIIQLPDGRWGACEIKLGISDHIVNEAATNLLRVAAQVNDNRRAFLAVITNGGIAHQRPDGVLVVPLRMLAP